MPRNYDVNTNFTHHPPFGNQAERYQQLRAGAKELAEQIIMQTPESREQSLALTKLEEAVFWANASIARNEKPSDYTQPAAFEESPNEARPLANPMCD